MSAFVTSVSTFFKQELSGWKAWEGGLLIFSCIVILGLSIYWGDTALGIISSTTGVAYTVCNGQGKRLAYVFGLVNSVLYAIISYNAGLFADAMLYGLYYIPAMIIGFILWNQHMDAHTCEVTKRTMRTSMRILLVVICAIGSCGVGFILQALDDAAPFLDAFTTVVSVAALVVALGRYSEQWAMWTAVNGVETIMWTIRFLNGTPEAGSSLIMWVLFLGIGIVMWVRWSKQTSNAAALCHSV